MKNWKKLLACLLAGMLVLSMLTACTVQQNGVMSASADSTKELCTKLNVKYSEDLSSNARAIANWMMTSSVSTRVDTAGDFHRINETNNDFLAALERKDYAEAFFQIGASDIGTADSITIGVNIKLMETEKPDDQVDFTVPVDGQIPDYMRTAAAGKTEVGAAYILWKGTRYIVTVFR